MPSSCLAYPTLICPCCVYLTALVTKLVITCWILPGSRWAGRVSRGLSLINSTCGFCTRSATEIQISSKVFEKSTSSFSRVIPPASSDERASRSLISRISMSQLFMITWIISCFSSFVCNIGSTSENPTIEFSGVRISWVMLAMKVLFIMPDCMARSVSFFSSSCFFMSGVMLRITP